MDTMEPDEISLSEYQKRLFRVVKSSQIYLMNFDESTDYDMANLKYPESNHTPYCTLYTATFFVKSISKEDKKQNDWFLYKVMYKVNHKNIKDENIYPSYIAHLEKEADKILSIYRRSKNPWKYLNDIEMF